MKTTVSLFENISKYMKFMAFIKSASPLTLRAYWVDLQQIFQWEGREMHPEWGPQAGGGFSAEGPAFYKEGPRLSETQLLAKAREAMQGWAGLSPASRNRKAATLKSFFGWLHAEGLTAADLSERISCPKVPRKLPHFVSVDEISAVISALNELPAKDVEADRKRALVLLLYGGGLRVSEACALKWSDVDESRRLIRVVGKGSKERLVPLPDLCLRALVKLKAAGGRYVFGNAALSTRVAYAWVRESGDLAGLHHRLHPHALRHSYATHLLAGGANLRTLQELLGHESLRATEKYTHLGVDQLARTLERHHPLGGKKRVG